MAGFVVNPRSGLAPLDVGARRTILLASVALVLITLLDVRTDGRLGVVFSVGFVLTAVTVPLAIDVRSLLPAGILPPVLLVACVGLAAALSPDAVEVAGLPEGTGWFGRTLTGTIDRGVTLLLGHGLALLTIVVRILTDPHHPRRTGPPSARRRL